MNYFLAKTEPQVYSIDDLERDRQTVWDGVRNAQALRALQSMKTGDRVFIYHSGGVSSIVGVATVLSEPRSDPADAKATVVELEYYSRIDPPVSLKEIKESGEFQDWALVRQSRLSTMAAPEKFVAWLKKNHPSPGL